MLAKSAKMLISRAHNIANFPVALSLANSASLSRCCMGSVPEEDQSGNDFPTKSLIVKDESQQSALMDKYGPHADGKNIIIAILDTGVDPSLPGLQVTSHGERKIIDCIDCSGAGDVDTSVVKTAVDGVVTGLTGRQLKIPSAWENPTGKWYLGIKPIYELYPKSLCKVVKEDWQKESWESPQQLAKTDALRQMLEHEEVIGGYSDKMRDKHDRENLACQIDFLKSVDKLEDKGPVADCIVWHNGQAWRACIDTSFRGRLSLCKDMGDFRETGEFSKLSERDIANYTFRIDSSGRRLEICLPAGAHGSHVANIAAAYYPDDQEMNGLAPGAKIISMMIADVRVNSMETGTSMIRAFNLCAQMNVDIINMSYGESTHFPDKGRVIDELKRIVNEHNIVFVASAGNSGPALSTVGSPGGTTSGVLGIAARICPKQAQTLYGVFHEVKSMLYPWSSRGPCVDGSLGVSLYAPGAAIAGVPRYCRKSVEMMNGTSMSSPNATGAIACMLSKMRANHMDWSPYRIRLALENTASSNANEEKFGCGQGLIQVLNGYEYMVRNDANFPPLDLIDINVTVKQGNKAFRGVYIRELWEARHPQEYTVFVKPKFKELSDNNHKSDFGMKISLHSDGEYLEFPRTLYLTAGEASFTIKVDPTVLLQGEYSYCEIVGTCEDRMEMGPIFRVPISVISPIDILPSNDYSFDAVLQSVSGVPDRYFLAVPTGATLCEIKVTNASRESSKERFTLHCVQLVDGRSVRNTESYKTLNPDAYEWKYFIPVVENRTLEVCLVRSWTRGSHAVTTKLHCRFHGVKRDATINLIHGSPSTPFRIEAASFRPVEIKPAISFTTLHVPFKPISSKIEPLGPRDLLARGKQIHRVLLTYKIPVTKSIEFRIDLPQVMSYLYESPYDCVLAQIFSATKEFIGASSSFPERYTHKVDKGEYTVQVQVRHTECSRLELLTDTPLHVRVHITPALSLDPTSEPLAAENAFKWTNKILNPSQQVTLYAGSLPDDKLPKGINIVSGSFLTGNVTLMSVDAGTKKVDKTSVTYIFTEYSSRPNKALSMVTLKEKTAVNEEQEMKDAIRDAQICWLTKLKDPLAVHRLYADLVSTYPDHLPLLLTNLRMLMDKKRSTTENETLSLVIEHIIELCHPDEVLKYFGSHHDHSVEGLKKKKEMEDRREAIADCMLVRAHRVVDDFLREKGDCPPAFRRPLGPVFAIAQQPKVEEKTKRQREGEPQKEDDTYTAIEGDGRVTIDEVECTYNELLAWMSSDDIKILLLSAKLAVARSHFGKAAMCLQKLIDDMRANGRDASVFETALVEVCEKIGWIHVANRLRNDRLVRNRANYRPF